MWQRTETKLFLTVFLIYGFYVTMTDPFNNVDALCVAMIEHGTFQIDARVMNDYAVVNGVKYSGYSPGASWLLAPLYAALKPLCVVAPEGFQFQAFSMLAAWLLTIPLGALCVVALYRLVREWEVEERAASLTALAFAFGTMWFAYARRHNSYSLISSALIFLSLFLMARPARKNGDPAVSGFLAMLAVTADYKQALSVLFVGPYLLLRHADWKARRMFAAGAIPPAIAMLAYNWQVFGHPLYTPAKFEHAYHGAGQSLQPGVVPLHGVLDFSWDHFWKLFLGPHTGLFVYMPLTLLAFVGAAHCWRAQRWMLLTAVGVVLSNAWLAASVVFWHGGGSETYYGPATRYLLPAVPFLMVLVAFAVQRVKPRIVHALVALSALVNWIFVLSTSYGRGASPTQPGWENLPLVVHARHIADTLGAESVWFNFLASSHFSLGKAGAAAITWSGAALVATIVWFIWRTPKTS